MKRKLLVPLPFTLWSPCPPSPCFCLLGLKPSHLDQPGSLLLWEGTGGGWLCLAPRGLGQPGRAPQSPQGHWADRPEMAMVSEPNCSSGQLQSRTIWSVPGISYLSTSSISIHTARKKKKSHELSPSLAKRLTFLWLQRHVPNMRVYI